MSETIEMVYRNGVFKPLRKVKLREGEIVRVEIKETKRVTKRFYSKLEELERKSKKVEGAYRTLEEIRNARY
ncbi:antitoxin family protein [Geoglobus acetivorans]|uniref:Antitoxin n=1 Tax=Geoglobus acetivorans TaxID=565033 RepID=A0A0A7GBG5_GEOAI|nr:hypothetical protein GACE_0338 [Geoglobus acetivorans]